MRFAYVLTITMLLFAMAAPDTFAQGKGRARGNTDGVNGRKTSTRQDDVYRNSSRTSDDGYRTGRASDDDGYRTGRAPQRDDRVYRREDDRVYRREDDRVYRRENDRVYGRDDDYYEHGKKGKGPKFCQNGQGHPVHGREWCEEHGYGNGRLRYPGDYRNPGDYRYPNGRRDPVWQNRSWEDVIFGRSGRDYPRDRRLSGSLLQDVLGRSAFRRFDNYRRENRLGGSLVGRWIDARNSRGRAMQLDAGSVPLARLFDYNGDGRVDNVQLNRLR